MLLLEKAYKCNVSIIKSRNKRLVTADHGWIIHKTAKRFPAYLFDKPILMEDGKHPIVSIGLVIHGDLSAEKDQVSANEMISAYRSDNPVHLEIAIGESTVAGYFHVSVQNMNAKTLVIELKSTGGFTSKERV